MRSQNSIVENPTENFLKFSSCGYCSHRSQIMDMAATIILFAELPGLQLHFDTVLDSIYITATYRVRLYIFFRRAFAVPPFNYLSDPAAPFLAIPLHRAHSVAPVLVPPPVTSPTFLNGV